MYFGRFESSATIVTSDAARLPATAEAHFYPADPNTPYRWDDYRSALAYLRRHIAHPVAGCAPFVVRPAAIPGAGRRHMKEDVVPIAAAIGEKKSSGPAARVLNYNR